MEWVAGCSWNPWPDHRGARSVFQNASAQIETRYGKETARLWKKAVAHTLYRGLPDGDTLRDIEHRSGKTSVMVRGFNVNNNQVNGSGDSLSEQSRPLLQVEDIREATGGDKALLDSRDHGFFTVDAPNFWERREMDGYLRDVRAKPDKYAWLGNSASVALSSPSADEAIEDMLESMRQSVREDCRPQPRYRTAPRTSLCGLEGCS